MSWLKLLERLTIANFGSLYRFRELLTSSFCQAVSCGKSRAIEGYGKLLGCGAVEVFDLCVIVEKGAFISQQFPHALRCGEAAAVRSSAVIGYQG